MNAPGSRRTLLAFACLAAALVSIVLLGKPAGAGAQGGPGELAVQPSLGAPTNVFLGASPGEADGEVWATAKSPTLARYTSAGGWEQLPAPVASGGGTILELQFAEGASAGRTTPNGGVAVEATKSGGGRILLVRDPGGAIREAPEPVGLLGPGEGLFDEAPMLAADEVSGHTRAFVVPESRQAVLDFDGE